MENPHKANKRWSLETWNPKLVHQLKHTKSLQVEEDSVNQQFIYLDGIERKIIDDLSYWIEEEKKIQQEDSLKCIVVWGVGAGYVFSAFSKWLEKNDKHLLILLESDFIFWKIFSQAPLFKLLENHPQVFLVQGDDNLDIVDVRLSKAFDLTLGKDFWVMLNPLRYPCKKNREKLIHNTRSLILNEGNLSTEVQELGRSFWRNFYTNLKHIDKFYLGISLKNIFKGHSVIICGAGPSLKDSIPLLRELQKHVFIAAGGSTMAILESYGIKAHLLGAIDPNAVELDRIEPLNNFEAPFLFRFRLYAECFKLIHGIPILLHGISGYEMGPFISGFFNLEEDHLDEGQSITTLLTSYMHYLGFSSIGFLGVDLCFDGDTSYAGDIFDMDKQSSNKGAISWESTTEAVKYDGQVSTTFWKWKEEAIWLSEFFQDKPEIEGFNINPRGLPLKGLSTLDEKGILNSHFCTKPVDMAGLIHTRFFSNIKKSIKKEEARSCIEILRRAFEKVEALVKLILTQIEEDIDYLLHASKQDGVVDHGGKLKVLMHRLKGSVLYDLVLLPFIIFIENSQKVVSIQKLKRGITKNALDDYYQAALLYTSLLDLINKHLYLIKKV